MDPHSLNKKYTEVNNDEKVHINPNNDKKVDNLNEYDSDELSHEHLPQNTEDSLQDLDDLIHQIPTNDHIEKDDNYLDPEDWDNAEYYR